MSPAAVILRSDDAPRIAALHGRAAEDPWPVQDYRALLKQESTLALGVVDEASDSLKSFVLCQIAVDTADILMVATGPNARRKGHARALLRSLIKRLGERGIARMTLDVAADNTEAIALYEAMAFAIDGRRPKYYSRNGTRIDAVLMSRPVTGLP